MTQTTCRRFLCPLAAGFIATSLASNALAVPPVVSGPLENIERITAVNEVTEVPFKVLAVPFIDSESTFELSIVGDPAGVTVSPTEVTTPTTEVDATLRIDRAQLSQSGPMMIELEMTRFTPPDGSGPAPEGETRIVMLEILDAPPAGSEEWLAIPMGEMGVTDRVEVDPMVDFALEVGIKSSVFDEGEPSFLFQFEQSAPASGEMLEDRCDILTRADVTRETSSDPMSVVATTLELDSGMHDAGGCSYSMLVRIDEDLVVHDFLVITPEIVIDEPEPEPEPNQAPVIVEPDSSRSIFMEIGASSTLIIEVSDDMKPTSAEPEIVFSGAEDLDSVEVENLERLANGDYRYEITFTAGEEDVGIYDIEIRASDTELESAPLNVQLTVDPSCDGCGGDDPSIALFLIVFGLFRVRRKMR